MRLIDTVEGGDPSPKQNAAHTGSFGISGRPKRQLELPVQWWSSSALKATVPYWQTILDV